VFRHLKAFSLFAEINYKRYSKVTKTAEDGFKIVV